MIEVAAVKGFGEIREGEVLIIEKRNGVKVVVIAKEVINRGKETEEILINKASNSYFIVSMYLDGRSWVKNVTRLLDVEISCITNNMRSFIDLKPDRS